MHDKPMVSTRIYMGFREAELLERSSEKDGRTYGETEFTGNLGGHELALGTVKLVDANRGEEDRGRNTMSKKFS